MDLVIDVYAFVASRMLGGSVFKFLGVSDFPAGPGVASVGQYKPSYVRTASR
jgi:hypothetical protein